jgi:hypothetical protein
MGEGPHVPTALQRSNPKIQVFANCEISAHPGDATVTRAAISVGANRRRSSDRACRNRFAICRRQLERLAFESAHNTIRRCREIEADVNDIAIQFIDPLGRG